MSGWAIISEREAAPEPTPVSAERAAQLGIRPPPTGRRVAAAIVDAIPPVIFMIPVVIGLPALLTFELWGLVVVGIGHLLMIVYAIVQLASHGRRGQTFGKQLMKIRTLSPDELRPIGFWRAVLKALVVALSGIVPLIGPAVVLLSPLWDREQRGRGWHDHAANAWLIDMRALDPTDPVAFEAARGRARVQVTPDRPVQPPSATAWAENARAARRNAAGAGQPSAQPAVRPQPAPHSAAAPQSTGQSQHSAQPAVRPQPAPQSAAAPQPSRAPSTAPYPGPAVPAAPGNPQTPLAPGSPGAPSAAPAVSGQAAAPAEPGQAPLAAGPGTAASAGSGTAAPADGAGSGTPPATPGPPSGTPGQAAPSGQAGAPSHAGPPSQASFTGQAAPGDQAGPPGQPGPAPTAPPAAHAGSFPPAAPAAPAPPGGTAPTASAGAARPAPAPQAGTAGHAPAASTRARAVVRIRFDSGEVIRIAGRSLIGRAPAAAEGEGTAHLLPIADDTRSVSKTHLAIDFDAAGIVVIDRNSTNGTWVVRGEESVPVRPGLAARVNPGERVRFGDRLLEVLDE